MRYGAPNDRHRAAVADALRAKRLRQDLFDDEIVSGPPWEMLLILYAAALEERLVSIEDMRLSCSTPLTVVVRWSNLLEQRGLTCVQDQEGMRATVCLTSNGFAFMRAYFDRVLSSQDGELQSGQWDG